MSEEEDEKISNLVFNSLKGYSYFQCKDFLEGCLEKLQDKSKVV